MTNYMVRIYAELIRKQCKTIEDVPEVIRAEVAAKLDDHE